MREYILAITTLLSIEIKAKISHLLISISLVSVVSFVVGWMVFGWLLFPVQWKADRINNAPYTSQVVYVYLISEWYAYSGNNERVSYFLNELSNADAIACNLAQNESDFGTKARLIKVAYLKNGQGCLP